MLGDAVPPRRRAGEAVARADLVGVLAVAHDARRARATGAASRAPRRRRRSARPPTRRRRRTTRRSRRRRPRCARRPRARARDASRPTARPVATISSRTAAYCSGLVSDADVRVVLRRGAHHRRPADVDEFDRRVGREGVEVADDEVDGRDAVLGRARRGARAWRRSARMPRVESRMQGLHAPVEHLGKPGDVGDVEVLDAGVARAPRPCRRRRRVRRRARASPVANSTSPVLSHTLSNALIYSSSVSPPRSRALGPRAVPPSP